MIDARQPLRLGYRVSAENIPGYLSPTLHEVTDEYLRHHPDLQSLAVIGSVALGEHKPGISDLDTIGVTVTPPCTDANRSRQAGMLAIGDRTDTVSFIDNSVIDRQQLYASPPEQSAHARGTAAKLAITGVCIWGEPLRLDEHMPTIAETAYGRAERARLLMEKYRSGDLIEPFRRDPRLLARSCAKAAMRVLSGITILRGAEFYSSPYSTAEQIPAYAPEALPLSKKAMSVIEAPSTEVAMPMSVTDDAVQLFYELFPRHY